MPFTRHRRSIARSVRISGVGLHTGTHCEIEFVPATWGRGITFVRTDLRGQPEIPASVDAVGATDRRTELRRGVATVTTVEHVMAAAAGLGISDLIVRLTGPEPPQMDGSALAYCEKLITAGLRDSAWDHAAFVVTAPLEFQHEMTRYQVVPSDEPRFTVTVEFPPPVGEQSFSFCAATDDFVADLAGARTFGFVSELDALRKRELIRGVSRGAGLLIGDDGVIDGTMRWPDECARHKALDLIGDLALLRAPVLGHIVAHRPGHGGNVGLARTVATSCRLETASAGHP